MNMDSISIRMPDNTFLSFDKHDIATNTTQTIRVELKSNCVSVYIDGFFYTNACSFFSWFWRWTYSIRRWAREET